MTKVFQTEKQLISASETLSVVRELIETDTEALRDNTPKARYWLQVCFLALQAVRTAQDQLLLAELAYGPPRAT